MPGFKLEEYDQLAKRRAILQHLGRERWEPVAWIDYDDVSKEEADRIANAALQGILEHVDDPPTLYIVRWAYDHDSQWKEATVDAMSQRQAVGKAIPEWDNDFMLVEVTLAE